MSGPNRARTRCPVLVGEEAGYPLLLTRRGYRWWMRFDIPEGGLFRSDWAPVAGRQALLLLASGRGTDVTGRAA